MRAASGRCVDDGFRQNRPHLALDTARAAPLELGADLVQRGLRIVACAVGLVLGGTLAGCGGREDATAPTEEEIEVLAEAMLLEGALQDFTGTLRDSLAVRYYDELYDRYGIDEAYLDDLRDRQADRFGSWTPLMDSVISRLERRRGKPDSLFGAAPVARQ